jgi:hypothetical protein
MFRSVTKVATEKETEASRAENDRQQDERELQTTDPKEHLRLPLCWQRVWCHRCEGLARGSCRRSC